MTRSTLCNSYHTQWIPGKPLCKESGCLGLRCEYGVSLWNHWLPATSSWFAWMPCVSHRSHKAHLAKLPPTTEDATTRPQRPAADSPTLLTARPHSPAQKRRSRGKARVGPPEAPVPSAAHPHEPGDVLLSMRRMDDS